MDKEKAFSNLCDAVGVLDKFGLRYFLTDGTLLGAVREGDFIGHDSDIDIGVFMIDWSLPRFAKVFEEMMRKGFILYHSFGVFGKHFECAWRRNGIKVDFFFYYEAEDDNGNPVYRFNAFNNGGRTLPDDIITYEYFSSHLEELDSIYFRDRFFICPSDRVKFLETKYGPEWRTPTSKWNWATSPKNIVATGQFL